MAAAAAVMNGLCTSVNFALARLRKKYIEDNDSEDPELRVKQLDRDSWLVKLDLNADEYYAAEPVKRVVVRYPLRVVRFDLDAERNKWGLALDCYQGTPQKISLPGGEP